MASSDRDFCTLCYDDGTSTDAVIWCTECEIFLCTDCEKHHKTSNMSKVHKTISTINYKKIPKFMQNISSQCRDHKKKFELYCSFHACPCCVQCATDKHQTCQEMKSLSDSIKQIKSSASVQLLEKDLVDVKTNFEEIIKYLNRRTNTNNTQKLKATEKIRSIKNSIDVFLNKIEQEIIDDLETKHLKLKSQMNSLLKQLKKRNTRISKLQNEFSKMTKYATELQMYVGMREIEKNLSKAAKYIEDLQNGDNFDETNLEITISSSLQSILKDVKSFGDIEIHTIQSTLQIRAGRKDQAQNLVPTCPRIEEIKPSMLRTLTIPEDMKSMNIIANRILPDGKYLILDSLYGKGQLLLFSNDGMFIGRVLTFKTVNPYDACFVGNNTVAVTLGAANETALVDLDKKKIIETIESSHFCATLASDGQILVISCNDKSSIVNLNDMSQTTLEKVIAGCVALFKGNIYGTIEKQVCCYKITGEPLWTFQHRDIDSPKGLTLDKNGFVYIVSRANNRIVVISPDGKTCKTLLSVADGIKYPWGIDINRETGMMIVGSEKSKEKGDTSFVYKI